MNKKAFIVFFLMAALVISGLSSCVSTRIVDNEHNARNSLDWEGVYTGTIPSGSGPGIDVRMILNYNQSFELKYEYLDRSDGPFNWAGSFQWDDTGGFIILDISGAPPYYRVGSNKLIQLDMKGKQIKGRLADNYVLKKVL